MYAQRRMSGAGLVGVAIGFAACIGASWLMKKPEEVRVMSSRFVISGSLAEGGIVCGAERDVHGLLVGVEVDRAVPALVSEAGGLDAAEGGAQVAHVVGVEPDHARLDLLRERVGALQVVRPDVGGEAVLRVVREGERLGVVVERRDRNDGPEDLLLEDP